MKTPQFTLWPWKILALLAPAVAFLAAYVAGRDSELGVQQRCAIFFSVLAAANGYLLAAAVGDFGRSILAVPAGMALGYCAVYGVLHQVGIVVAFFVEWVVLMRLGVYRAEEIREEHGHFMGCFAVFFTGVILPLFFLFMLAMVGEAISSSLRLFDSSVQGKYPSLMYGLPFSYIFICAGNTASMPLDWNTDAVRSAVICGIAAATHGLRSYLIAFLALAVAFSFFMRGNGFLWFYAINFICALICNYVCIAELFPAIRRVQAERKTPVQASDEHA